MLFNGKDTIQWLKGFCKANLGCIILLFLGPITAVGLSLLIDNLFICPKFLPFEFDYQHNKPFVWICCIHSFIAFGNLIFPQLFPQLLEDEQWRAPSI
ncbi:hypothetical protein GDO81_010331 [Engystomops pustulosus]|uniref:Uncharacterized protein n=1 Tax=Engystomops pustulosus TaxID=76066 RepID=A0AAV7BZQ7_ENGPU|nr:hypothetical protein GDO81_010331 [Engystomops pustulosus]